MILFFARLEKTSLWLCRCDLISTAEICLDYPCIGRMHIDNLLLTVVLLPTSDERKIGNIAPVPKGALSADSNNYRPITILPVMSKVAEKLIFIPLYKYLEANAYLPSSQYAYRKKLGTCDALLDISSLVQENLDKGFETRIVQIDFSAAFDLVNHRALVYKLKELGIGGNLLNILKDFLHNRKQSFSQWGR